ncbi:MAG: DUF3048 C-terminal domain-containing protein, partial [Clostridia bacterium]|nr:DUF3048 C-terminal domain-containing protein [Clostridia bacterium]
DEGSSLDTTWKSLREIAKIKNYSLENTTAPLPFRFADKPGYSVGNPIGKIEFSAGDRVSVSYRKSTGQYETSLNTSSSLSFSNVILLLTNVNGYYSPDKSETSLDLSAGGKGFCYTGGGSASFSWSIQDGVLSFTCEDGSPLTLNPGKTYIAALKVTDCASISAQ